MASRRRHPAVTPEAGDEPEDREANGSPISAARTSRGYMLVLEGCLLSAAAVFFGAGFLEDGFSAIA